jgi:uncharacterized membrane protein
LDIITSVVLFVIWSFVALPWSSADFVISFPSTVVRDLSLVESLSGHGRLASDSVESVVLLGAGRFLGSEGAALPDDLWRSMVGAELSFAVVLAVRCCRSFPESSW